jgi:hypothetical protein
MFFCSGPNTEFVGLRRALLQRVSHAKRTCGPLLFVIGHTLHQPACTGLGFRSVVVAVNKQGRTATLLPAIVLMERSNVRRAYDKQ